MIRNRLLWISFVALAVRFTLILWSVSGVHAMPQNTLSVRYFQEGYAISAGWGYSTGTDEAFATLTPQQQRVERGESVSGAAVPRPAGFYGETLHPPGMSLLVAAMHRIFGGNSDVAVMVFGALLDTVTALILFLMIRAVWSEPVAFIAGLTYALFLPQAFASTADRLPNGLETFFVVASFACVLRGVRLNERRPLVWFAIAGVVLGLGGYLRPDYNLLAVGLLPFLWLYLRNFWKATKASLVMLSLTWVMLLPWAYRNHLLYDRWIFTSSAVGSTLVEGLGEFRNPWGIGYSDIWLEREAHAHGFKSAWTPEADDYFNKVFIKDISENPAAYAAAIGKRLPLTLAPAFQFGYQNPLKTKTFKQERLSSGLDRYQLLLRDPLYIVAAYWDGLLFASVALIFLVCSLYMLWAERRRWQLVALLMTPHIYGIGVHLLSDAEARYLMPSLFSLMIGFAYCVQARRCRISESVPYLNSTLAHS